MTFKQQLGFFIRSFFLQTGWNYLKYQNLGFLFVMWPFLKNLYHKDPDALPSVVTRYLATFNTQPVLASFCFGALAKQEEHIAHAKTLTEFNEEATEWNAIKRGLTITTASIGDRLFWGTLKPLTLLLALFIWLLLGIHVFEIQPEDKPPLLYMFAASAASSRTSSRCSSRRSPDARRPKRPMPLRALTHPLPLQPRLPLLQLIDDLDQLPSRIVATVLAPHETPPLFKMNTPTIATRSPLINGKLILTPAAR